MADVPEEVLSATRPQLASDLLDARALGIRAAFVAGDEVYGGRQLRRGIRQRGNGAAIWCGHGIFAHNLVKISTLAG